MTIPRCEKHNYLYENGAVNCPFCVAEYNRPALLTPFNTAHESEKLLAGLGVIPPISLFKNDEAARNPHDLNLRCDHCNRTKGAHRNIDGACDRSAPLSATASLVANARDRADRQNAELDAEVAKHNDNPLNKQEGGGHYKSLKIQPIEYIHANNIPFAEGSVIKYVSRWRDKGGIEDLKKAKHFLELLIALEAKNV